MERLSYGCSWSYPCTSFLCGYGIWFKTVS